MARVNHERLLKFMENHPDTLFSSTELQNQFNMTKREVSGVLKRSEAIEFIHQRRQFQGFALRETVFIFHWMGAGGSAKA